MQFVDAVVSSSAQNAAWVKWEWCNPIGNNS
jgi:hypothetical protein